MANTTNTVRKTTKRENFTEIMNLLNEMGKTELAKVMAHEIDLLNSKAGALKKPSATQIENDKLKVQIMDFLTEADRPVAIAEIMNEIGKSNQKTNSLLIQLRNENKIIRTYEKKVAMYSLPDEVEAE